MKRLLVVLVASAMLGLVAGVGPAWATLTEPPSGTEIPLQSATQSNEGTNTANQTATSAPTVVSGPNVAVANGWGGGDTRSSCNPCGGDGGTTTQNSGNEVDASATNNATQVNDQSNGAGQSQTVGQDGGTCCSTSSGSAEQSADQSNQGTNEANQTATSAPVVVSVPNVAVLNGGDVHQNSGNDVDASSENNATQVNNQSNGAGQSQTVGHGGSSCCEKSPGSAEQSADQSNEGSNKANQTATSAPIVVSGGNYAILNKGDVQQNSGNKVDASTTNNATQVNDQSNGAGQSQTVGHSGSGCCSKSSGSGTQAADQSNWGKNEANQTATSTPIVVSGPNVAIANGWGHDKCDPCGESGGDVHQNSGNWVDASATNNTTQVNDQSNGLGQSQRAEGGGWGCCSQDGGATQTADQSNWGKNKANQTATSAPLVVSGGNYAILNEGDVRQNSGNWVDASATNNATQVNDQSNGLGQSQRVKGGGGWGCCSEYGGATQTADQSNRGKNEANQTATSAPLVVSGPNFAVLNFGDVRQNSGNKVDASATNNATQVNNQSNGLGQEQRVKGGEGCCPPKDDCQPRGEPRCPPQECQPRECKPKRCEPKRCEPKCDEDFGTSRRGFAGSLS
ncbi:MAG: hypothetical protein V7645_2524 [Actinomycetota bacterium]